MRSCGYDKTECLVIHHVVERAQGGLDHRENLLWICPYCHEEIHRGVEGPALDRQRAQRPFAEEAMEGWPSGKALDLKSSDSAS